VDLFSGGRPLGDIYCHLSRASAYAQKGEYDKAIADYTKEIELCCQDPIAFYERGHVYTALGKRLEAMADFESYIKLSKEPELVEEAKQEIGKLHTEQNN